MSLDRNISRKSLGYALKPESKLSYRVFPGVSVLEALFPCSSVWLIVGTSDQEKKLRRDQFDLSKAVHEAEYAHLQKPIDPATQKLLEPDHRFVVTLEPDEFTEEVCYLPRLRAEVC
jgi:hypothetical protein